MPKVSVITPSYNVERYLGQTIESVLGQTCASWEHIIVDDGSTDATGSIADQYAARDPRIKVVHQANAGAPAARVAGYRAADPDGLYVIWLDGDDILEPRMLETLVEYLDTHTHVGVALCNRQHIDEAGNPIMLDWHPTRLAPGLLVPSKVPESQPETSFATLFVQDAVSSPSATLIRRAVYDQTPGWDVYFGQPFEDWDLMFQLALAAEVHYLPFALTRYRMGRPGQSTANPHRGRGLYIKLYSRWSRYETVPPDKVHIVAAAIRFREGQALPFQHFEWGNLILRRGKPIAALWSYARAVRDLGWYALQSLMGTYDRQLRASNSNRTG
jgi:glycosyltransferase involved in cell wall biosynthesis